MNDDDMPEGYSWWETALDALGYAAILTLLIAILVIFGEPL